MQRLRKGWRSLGEIIRIHEPLALTSTGKRFDKKRMQLECQDFSGTQSISKQECERFLNLQTFHNTHASYESVLARTSMKQPSKCEPGTSIIIALSWRDYNVCHIMMKLLFAHTITQRVKYTPKWLNIPSVKRVILLGDATRLRYFDKSPEKFHLGFAQSLFTKHGIDFVTTGSIDTISNSNACYEVGVFLGSLANRFAFADRTIGENAGYNISQTGIPSRKFPLSSDAVSFRNYVFGKRAKPMKLKVVYVFRGGKARRRWTDSGSVKMDALLRRVTKEVGAELVVFKPKRGDGFYKQVSQFEDAAVIIGIHGAGLALSIFAPNDAALIEIEPAYHSLSLFKSVAASGLSHDMIRLSKESTQDIRNTSNLLPQDETRIAKLLKDRLLERKPISK